MDFVSSLACHWGRIYNRWKLLAVVLPHNKIRLVANFLRNLEFWGVWSMLPGGPGFYYKKSKEGNRGGHDGNGCFDRAPDDDLAFIVWGLMLE